MRVTIPANVCIKRFYRAYVEADENATGSEIKRALLEQILEEQDAALAEDPDIGIEAEDILFIDPDYDGAWSEEDEKDIKDALEKITPQKE